MHMSSKIIAVALMAAAPLLGSPASALPVSSPLALHNAVAPSFEAVRYRGRGFVGAGIGLAAGAIIGGAIANSGPRYYGPAPGYVVYEGYGAPYPASCPGGYWARRPVRDGYGNVVGWSRPRFICP